MNRWVVEKKSRGYVVFFFVNGVDNIFDFRGRLGELVKCLCFCIGGSLVRSRLLNYLREYGKLSFLE